MARCRRIATLRSVERISTAEAARRLGISQSGVRRRIRTGALRAEIERRPQGSRLVVLWDAPADAHQRATVGGGNANEDANTRTETEKDALIVWLQVRLEQSEQAQGELRRMLNLEQQTVAALREMLATPRTLPAPADANLTPTESPSPEPSPTRPAEAPEPAATTSRRPWWQRWFGGCEATTRGPRHAAMAAASSD